MDVQIVIYKEKYSAIEELLCAMESSERALVDPGELAAARIEAVRSVLKHVEAARVTAASPLGSYNQAAQPAGLVDENGAMLAERVAGLQHERDMLQQDNTALQDEVDDLKDRAVRAVTELALVQSQMAELLGRCADGVLFWVQYLPFPLSHAYDAIT
jgi:hypothetical protein